MAVSIPPLYRLLRRETVHTTLQAFAPLCPNLTLRLYNPDGQIYAELNPSIGISASPAALPPDQVQSIIAHLTGPNPVEVNSLFFYPLFAQDTVWGALASPEPSAVLVTLQTSLNQLLNQGLELYEIGRETLRRYQEINLLYYIAETIGSSLDADAIPRLVLSEANRIIQTPCGIAMRLTETGQPGDIQASFGSDRHIQGLVDLIDQQLQSSHLSHDKPDIIMTAGDAESVNAVLYAPLKLRGQIMGLLAIGRFGDQPAFTASDKKLLTALTNQARISLENAWLHEQEIQRQRFEQELSIGQRIQRSLLPIALPQVPGWQLAASYQSASQVGGDLYDVFLLPESDKPELGITVADVTGKGVPAALMMAFSRAVLRSAASLSTSPVKILQRTNDLILHESHSGLFLSMFYAVLDPANGRLRYANAGHEPPVWYHATRDRCIELKTAKSVLLGAFKDITYYELEMTLEHGDFLVLYTDGITEARSLMGEFFGEERLYTVIKDYAAGTAKSILQGIRQAIDTFTRGALQTDDITILVIKRE